MRILMISKDGDSLDLALRLSQEDNSVKFVVQEQGYREIGAGFGLATTSGWRQELPWVGREGLIIFDSSGFGDVQDSLRAEGFSVVGGSAGGDRLEFDRYDAQRIFKRSGMVIVPSQHFESADDAIDFVKKKEGRWVVKQNGHADKCFSYRGTLPDGSDVIDLLESYKTHNHGECGSLDLQQRVDGIEIGVARYFNGLDWVGPIEMNIEHKKLFPGGLGPKTPEMGTVVWYDDDEGNKLFRETLGKLRPHLQTIDFRGDIDINCIVNEDGPVPLEATPRFGYPALHVQSVLNRSPWGEFLKAVADGRSFDLEWQKGFGVVVLIAVPPFPYQALNGKYSPRGLRIRFSEELTAHEWDHVHFSEVSLARASEGEFEHVVAAEGGYVMCVTGTDTTVQAARQRAYSLARKVVIPKMFYREDIGLKFVERDRDILQKWGYL